MKSLVGIGLSTRMDDQWHGVSKNIGEIFSLVVKNVTVSGLDSMHERGLCL